MFLLLKAVYRKISKIPGANKVLNPIVLRIRKSNFDYDRSTSLEVRIIYLESAIAGLDERIQELEQKHGK